jgi:hypothetical protein
VRSSCPVLVTPVTERTGRSNLGEVVASENSTAGVAAAIESEHDAVDDHNWLLFVCLMKYELTFRLGRTHPACDRSSGSEMLSHIRSLAGSIIDTLESSFQKRQVPKYFLRQR